LIPGEDAVEEPDPHVIRNAKAGDLQAFESLVRRYQRDVYRFALHLTSDPSLSEDVTQDTFVRAYRFLRRYRGDSRFSTWLFSIARNCVHDEFRRAGRRSRLSDSLEAREVVANPTDRTSDIEVREALATLPQELLESVVIIDMFGFSYREAEQLTGTPEGTLKSRAHRGRERLVSLLGPHSEEHADEG
jgi:RNA polymerase sigma-70 factor (ECF subfamily)